MKIYTRTGDAGDTGLFAGPRVTKDDPRIEAYGTVDELNAIIGQARATPLEEQVDETLGEIQNYLFVVGAELATPDPQASQLQRVDAGAVEVMEERIDAFEKQLAPLNQFILPGGTPEAAHLHVARTVCRRAERRVVTLARSSDDEIAPTLIHYLNRLGDLLFVLARLVNAQANVADIPWEQPPTP